MKIVIYFSGKTVAWEQACKLLETRFTKPAPKRCTTVLLVDEVLKMTINLQLSLISH